MSHWNYRILRHEDKPVWYSFREVYYDDNGNIEAYSETPIITGNTAQDIISTLKTMLNDAESKPVGRAIYE